MSRRLVLRLLVSGAVLAGSLVTGVFLTSSPAHADACFTWSRTLRDGMTGADVSQLQIRLAGYADSGAKLAIDGDFGPATARAVTRFERAYGLAANGVADSATFNKIYQLQDDDCTPIHFTYAELNKCNSTWAGGRLSAATAKRNGLIVMWQLEALRHALGDRPIIITSGFRSEACNRAVGGSPNSRHLYGDAADLAGSHSLCTLATAARNRGFTGILGPGYPDHNDHVHVDDRPTRFWSAPSCGI